jgi:membrane protein implicated in regulation of membrane protease activity
MKKEWKLNITAFLLAGGMVLSLIGLVCLIIWIGVLLGASLPYVVSIVLLLGLVYAISIPIRDVLEDRENAREYQKKKDGERKRMGWLPN